MWWAVQDLNLWPLPCQGDPSPAPEYPGRAPLAEHCLEVPGDASRSAENGSRFGALAPLQRPKWMPGLRRSVMIRRLSRPLRLDRWPKDPSGVAACQEREDITP